ncbi:MAG TPA: DUF4845 domain-containing protein [Steroidobacteraceae bacterium]|nr:DUF4845 domain-containing protein [Steroidobacteraceae bacterium]
MHKRQRGVTLIGWVILLIPIAVLGFAGIKLVPVYLNYMSVARSVTQTASEYRSDNGGSEQQLRFALEKHFDIESISFPDPKDVSIKRNGQQWVIEARYQDVVPLFFNISLLLDFDKAATTS